ncbi:MAG: hypothetical protein R6V44_02590 [Paracoccaceae bacterium]
MKSPRFDLKEEMLPVLGPEDHANPGPTDLRAFNRLQAYIGIMGGPAGGGDALLEGRADPVARRMARVVLSDDVPDCDA